MKRTLLLPILLMLLSTACAPRPEERPLGRILIQEPAQWWCVSNNLFQIFSRDESMLDTINKKTTYSFEKAKELLGVDQPVAPPTLYVMSDMERWNELIHEHNLLSEGVSLQSGREILLLIQDKDDFSRDAVPHELIHYIIHEQQLRLPLALEEGIALHFGWAINLDAHLSQGNVVTRHQRPVAPDNYIDFDHLVSLEAYPENTSEMKAFYYQSERFVRAINTLVPSKEFPAFIKKVGTGDKNWQDVLLEEYDCTPEQIKWVRGMTTP